MRKIRRPPWSRIVSAATVLLPLAAASVAWSTGAGPGGQDPVPVYRAGVELVVFNVAVLDEEGLPVTDLEADDFRLLQNGREQEISLFASPESSDLDVALVLDASSSVAQNAPTVREDAMAFLDALGPHDCVYFVPFRESVDESVWAAPDDPRLAARIGGLALEGGTALYDALVVAFSNVHRNVGPLLTPPPDGWPQQGYDGAGCGARLPPRALGIPGTVRRTALVVLSDGGDEHSTAGFAETLGVAWSDPVPIFAVAVGDALPPQRDHRLSVGSAYARSFRRRGDIAEALTGRLGYLAHVSGGRLILGGDSDTLGESFDTVVQMLRSSYLVGYKPPDDADAVARGGLVWHPVSISVPRRDVEVFARPGYYRRLVDTEGAARIVRETLDDVGEGSAASALPMLDFALRLDPDYWPALLQRARARLRVDDLPGARDDLLRVLDLRPGTLDAHYLLANVAYDLGEYDLAWQQAVRAHRGGALVNALMRALQEVYEPPADLQEQLRAPATFVDIGATPDELDQGTMLEVLRALRRAVSDAPDLALMSPWNAADLGIILDVEEIGGSPRRLKGEFVLTYAPYLSWEDENVEIKDVDDPAAVAEGLRRALDKVRAMVAEQR